jgi:hypothetical protein
MIRTCDFCDAIAASLTIRTIRDDLRRHHAREARQSLRRPRRFRRGKNPRYLKKEHPECPPLAHI